MSTLIQAVEDYHLESRAMVSEILKRTIKRKFAGTLFCEPHDKIRLRIDGVTFVTELRNLDGIYRIPLNHIFTYDTSRYIESGLLLRISGFVAAASAHKERITAITQLGSQNANNK